MDDATGVESKAMWREIVRSLRNENRQYISVVALSLGPLLV